MIVVVEVVGVVVLQTVVLAAVNRPTHPVSHLVHRHQILSYVHEIGIIDTIAFSMIMVVRKYSNMQK